MFNINNKQDDPLNLSLTINTTSSVFQITNQITPYINPKTIHWSLTFIPPSPPEPTIIYTQITPYINPNPIYWPLTFTPTPSPPEPIRFLRAANNVLVMALMSNRLIRIHLEHPDNPEGHVITKYTPRNIWNIQWEIYNGKYTMGNIHWGIYIGEYTLGIYTGKYMQWHICIYTYINIF